MANKINIKTVAELEERMRDAKAIVFVDYKGINVEEVNSLRERMRKNEIDYFVAKNTLVKLALNNLGIKELDDKLIGPTAIAVSKTDEVAPARELRNIIKELFKDKNYPTFKDAYVAGKYYDLENVKKLAELPSREQLISLLLAGMNAPIAGLVFTLKGILSSFVYTVQGISEKQE